VDKATFLQMVADIEAGKGSKVTTTQQPKPRSRGVQPSGPAEAPAEWVNYVRKPTERDESEMTHEQFLRMIEQVTRRPPQPARRRQPKATRMESPRMRAVGSQTNNGVRAAYQADFIKTPVRYTPEGLTLNVGPGCMSLNDNSTGHTTQSRNPGDPYKKEVDHGPDPTQYGSQRDE
jgi:hypothetical protein